MTAILFVRIKSDLPFEELERRASERKPQFLEVPGLYQKFYVHDPATGDVGGIYFFENREALTAYRDSELAKTIPAAYEATEVRPEVFELMYPLYPDRGPSAP
jgi:hypothetical protein